MTEAEAKGPKVPLDPGAFQACLFLAYKGDCDCQVCQVLRGAVDATIAPYLGKTAKGKKPSV